VKIRFAVAPGADVNAAGLFPFAHALEASGFDGIWLSDLPVAPLLDPLLAIATIAARTERLRLGANVVPLGRNPFLLAKELAQLDHLSNGRLLLSFVPGLGRREERKALGVDGADRGALLEEALGLMRIWWAGDEVRHRSETWSFPGTPSVARPLQDPLEVWLGGRGPKALERVGRIADGWLGALVTPDEAAAARERIDEAARRAGREFDPEHFGLSIGYARREPGDAVLTELHALRPDIDPRSMLPVGAHELRQTIDRLMDAGLSKFVLRPLQEVTAWDDEAAWLGDAILHLQT
jgi:probable F420-dependent oxidoreductase